jgi:hypothetical protein
VIPSVRGFFAGFALLLDVADLSVRPQLAIPTDHTTTAEGRETEKSYEAHLLVSLIVLFVRAAGKIDGAAQQLIASGASVMP